MMLNHLQYRVWEYDAGKHDEIYSSPRLKVVGNIMTHVSGFKITKERFQKGVDLPYGDPDEQVQNYFIEVLPLDISVSSKKFGIDTSVGLMTVAVEKTRTPTKVGEGDTKPISTNCGGKFCIKKGDKNELIREINIRLSGFGGNVPTDEFTERTERMIKQFQRDYMKVPETGKICGNVLRAIDEFSRNFDISESFWKQLKCSCSTKGKQAKSKLRGIQEVNNCDGFGDGTGANTLPEKSNKYEYPGIHRSLLFGFKALQFYFSKQRIYKIDHITSGYRCRFKGYKTTNHQGKAIDIQFSKGDWKIRGAERKNLSELRAIRDNIFIKKIGAQKEWEDSNLFSIEPIDLLYDSKGNIRNDHTYSWIHIDVRTFDKDYLDNRYFCKNKTTLNGKSIVQIAYESGNRNLCSCMGSYTSQNNTANEKSDERVDPKTLKTSKRGKDFIKSWENFYAKPYDDTEGYATIGIGYLIAYKSYKHLSKSDIEKTEITWDEFLNGISEERALDLFNKKIELYEKSVQRDIKVNLYQHEFDALVSLLFNTGQNFLNTGGARGGETKIKKNINNKLYEEGADEMADVTNGGTKGLVRRRTAEIKMFKNNEYDNNK